MGSNFFISISGSSVCLHFDQPRKNTSGDKSKFGSELCSLARKLDHENDSELKRTCEVTIGKGDFIFKGKEFENFVERGMSCGGPTCF
jgi:hypothetical protein